MAERTPILTASGEVIYGETPEDGILAMFYGDPDLAAKAARAVNMHDRLVAALETIAQDSEEFSHGDDVAQAIVRGLGARARALLTEARKDA